MNKEAIFSRLLKSWRAGRTAVSSIKKPPSVHMEEAIKNLAKKGPPKGFSGGVHGADPKKAWEGYLRQSVQGGDGSLLLWPIKTLAEKVIGGSRGIEKVRGAAWKFVHEPSLRADMAVGRVLGKIPGGQSLFRVKEKVPWGKPGQGLEKEITRSSALAPIIKARDIAEPILVGVGLEKGLKKLHDMTKGHKSMDDQNLREKAASVMLHLHEQNKEHEKRGHALKYLYKRAELGYDALPRTFSELETKLAALVTEDLVVLEKALELAGGNIKLGELDSRDLSAASNSAEKFQAAILGDEI